MPAKKETTHESLIEKISEKELELKEAKQAYKEFCAGNPLKTPKQPTLHELRKMREKNDKPSLEDHKKSNKSASDATKKEQLKQELNGD